jgi:hypothetical protein
MVLVRAVLCLFLGSVGPPPQRPPGSDAPTPNLAEGVYQLGSAHNFDAYLAELGVNLLLRRLAGMVTPTVTVSRYMLPFSRIMDGTGRGEGRWRWEGKRR